MRGAGAVEYVNRSVKFILPNGNVVDLLSEVLATMSDWKQRDPSTPESCGFILGYMNSETKNITLSSVTYPQHNAACSRVFCKLKTFFHFRQLRENEQKKNYYMGTWHTHPQRIPGPSTTDWSDWRETLEKDTTGCEFAFFIIIGLEEFRIWAGNLRTKEVVELVEAPMSDGIYKKGDTKDEN